MASNASRLILLRSSALLSPRYMCTSIVTVSKDREKSLYHKLYRCGDSEANVTNTIREWVSGGNSVKKWDLVGYINQFRKCKKYHTAIKLYEWMEKSKIKMNNTDKAIRIDLIGKTEGVAAAEKYFKSLPSSARTKKTYGALLNCYCKEKLDKASELFETMKKLDLTSTLNYNNMMTLHLSLGQPERVSLLAEEMKGKNIAADSYTYIHLMNSHAALKNIEAVEGVLKKMEADKVKRDWFIYVNLSNIFINLGVVQKANAVLEEMEKMKLHEHEAFHSLITSYGRTSNLTGVHRAWECLKSTFPKPNNASYLVMLSTLSKLGDVGNLEKCFKDWESNISICDVRVSNVMLESYLNRKMIKEAELVYENMVKSGAEPDLRTHELLTNFYIKNRQTDLALKYLEMGACKANPKKHNWFPSDETVRMFLEYFEEEKDAEKAEKFCESMKKIDRLDPTVYDSLLCTNIAGSGSGSGSGSGNKVE